MINSSLYQSVLADNSVSILIEHLSNVIISSRKSVDESGKSIEIVHVQGRAQYVCNHKTQVADEAYFIDSGAKGVSKIFICSTEKIA